MHIEGLDYNTQRTKLVLPEYGREIQKMVEHCMSLEDREQRQLCAETIVETMRKVYYPNDKSEEIYHKLWDQLAIISQFKLDIDFPFDIQQAAKIYEKPQPLAYPKQEIPLRHYGAMVFELFDKLKNMEEGPERDALVELTISQMRHCLDTWGRSCKDDEKIASDLARFTDGRIQI